MFILNFCAIILKKARWGKIKDRILKDFFVWIGVIAILAITLSQLDYRARENDSRLYTKFLQQITKRPLREMVVVHWEESAYSDPQSPYVRDHLIGQFIIPFLMVRMGIPAKDALYLFNTIVQIGCLYLLFYLLYLVTHRLYYEVLIFTMLLPQSWVYILRANHEQPLLLCTLLAMVAGIKLKTGGRWLAVGVLAILWAFLIKGLGFVMVPIAFATSFWLFTQESFTKKVQKLLLAVVVITVSLAGLIYFYEQWFVTITHESFFKRYWEIQIVGRSLKSNSHFSWWGKLKNIQYYLGRVLAYSLPWSLIGLILGVLNWKHMKSWIHQNKKTILLFGGYSLLYCVVFGQFERRASRYLFPVYYLFYALMLHLVFSLKPNWQIFSNNLKFRNLWYRYSAVLWLGLHLLALGIYYAKGGYGYWEH